MGRLIDADTLSEHKFQEVEFHGGSLNAAYRQGWNDDIDSIVDNEDAVDAVPVRRGRWIQVSQDRANCNRCNCESGKMIKQGERYFPKFCPECGADMRKDGEAHGTK